MRRRTFFAEVGSNIKRLTSSDIIFQQNRQLLSSISTHDHFESSRLKICNDYTKGRCVFATVPFNIGDFVVRYKGQLLTSSIAKKREKLLSDLDGSFILYFDVNGISYAIDSTTEPDDPSSSMGRLVNHCKKHPNAKLRALLFDGEPVVVLIACKRIEIGTEIVYNYGDTRHHVLKHNKFLKYWFLLCVYRFFITYVDNA